MEPEVSGTFLAYLKERLGWGVAQVTLAYPSEEAEFIMMGEARKEETLTCCASTGGLLS
jgi:hypothetical protein